MARRQVERIWDWRDPEKYRSVEHYSPAQLSWEFLRRNREYQADWQRLTAPDRHRSGWGVEGIKWMRRWGFYFSPVDPHRDDPGEGHLGLLPPWAVRNQLEPRPIEQVTMIFDLSLPVKPQLQRAASILRSRRAMPEVRDKIKRRRPKLAAKHVWPVYLRVLDAWAAGATEEQIAEVLEPTEHDPVEKVRELLRQARKWTWPERYRHILRE